MCVSPINIESRSLVLSSGTPLRLTVPCGKCSECARITKSDYFVRAYFEYLKTKNDGGFTYFETLTYNDDNLPRYGGMPCFSKYHIRLFFQRLKSSLKKLGYTFGNESQNYIRYLVTCEYGGKNRRPHYHCLLFVNCPCLTVEVFKRLVNDAWKFGFCNPIFGWRTLPSGIRQPITVYTWLVQGPEFLRYCVKYVTKDFGYLKDFQAIEVDPTLSDRPDCNIWAPGLFTDFSNSNRAYLSLDRYESYFQTLENGYITPNNKYLNKHDEIYKEIAPFHLSSIHFGFSLLENLSEEEINDCSFILQTGIDGIDQRHNIPKYLQRKLFQDFRRVLRDDGNYYVEWYYNDFGISHKLKTFQKNVERTAKDYSHLLENVANLFGLLVRSDTEKADQINGIYQRLLPLCKDINYYDVAAYSLFYRYTYTPYWFSKCPDIRQQVLTKYDKSAMPCEYLDYKMSAHDRLTPFMHNMVDGRPGSFFNSCEQFMSLYDNFKKIINSDIELSDNYKFLVKQSLQKCQT